MLKTLLTTHDVAYATSTQELFSKISVTIKENDRIGLIGKNGTGKTTFLKLLNEELEPDSGTVIKNGSVGYVPQIEKESHQHIEVGELLQSKECPYERFSRAYEIIFSSMVPDKNTGLETMSGGERTKLWIALVASQNPSVILLDEPTNHLDRKSIGELKRWIEVFQGAVVFVSHNRSFLSDVAGMIWELETCTITAFGGSYNDFLDKKQHDAIAKERKYEATKKELKSLEKGVRMRETKAARAAKAQRKNKSEPNRNKGSENYFRNRSEKGIGKIKKKHDIQRAEIEESLDALHTGTHKTINLPLDSRSRSGGLLIDTKGLAVRAGQNVLLNDIELRIEYGDRLAIQGDNGVGKTLLVKKLLQEIERPTKGVSNVGADIKVEYINQQYEMVNLQQTVFENIENNVNVVDHELVYKQIGRFGFPEHYANKKAGELSGGEVARLAFAVVTVTPIDLLVLDEPTNNLDIDTVDVIMDTLNDFKGSLIVISHDTSFLDGLEIQQSFLIDGEVLLQSN